MSSKESLERARKYWDAIPTMFDGDEQAKRLAALLDRVREEAIEKCAAVVMEKPIRYYDKSDRPNANGTRLDWAAAIRALKVESPAARGEEKS